MLKVGTDVTCGIGGTYHKEGVKATGASFDISLKEAFSVANAAATLAKGSTFTLTVKIGDKELKITASYTGATITKGMSIGMENIKFSLGSATSVSFTAGDASYAMGVTIKDGVLTFEKKASQAALDFDAAMKVEIKASKAEFNIKH